MTSCKDSTLAVLPESTFSKGSVMNDIEHNFVDTVSTERILQWRAAIQELVSVVFAMEFILDHFCEIAQAFFMRKV